MAIPPKKLKAFVEADSKKRGKKPPEDEEDDAEPEEGGEQDEGDEGDDEGKKGNPFGKGGKKKGGEDEGGERHISPEETQEILTRAENEVANGPDAALVEAMTGYDGSGEPPPGFDSSVWEAATEIVGPEDYPGEDPWMVVAHVYKRLGGKVEGGLGAGADEGAGFEGGSED